MNPGMGGDLPDLARTRAEWLARSVLPCGCAIWAGAEVMHLTGAVPVTDVIMGAVTLTAVSWAAALKNGSVPSLPWWAALAGGWVAAADVLGPLAWWPAPLLTAAWLVYTLAAYRFACRHEAVVSAREWRDARIGWLGKRNEWHLGGSHLLDFQATRLGELYTVSTRGTGRRASQLAGPALEEVIAEAEELAASRVRTWCHGLAGRLMISIRRVDPWADVLLHPLACEEHEITLPGRRSILDPAVVGQDPETGEPLTVPLYDEAGGKNVSITSIKGGGKALALDTPLPTPSGWTTMGAVKVGDWLLGQDGRPTRVTAATEVMHGHDCYDVQFSDGSIITADADHLWLTEDRRAWRLAKAARLAKRDRTAFPAVCTTAEIAATLREPSGSRSNASNHAIANCRPFDLPEADLLIPPYTLGAWLGDGTARKAVITSADPEVLSRIEADGFRVSKMAFGPYAYRLTFDRKTKEVVERTCVVCQGPFTSKYASQRTCGNACGVAWRESGGRRQLECTRCGARTSGTGDICRQCRWATTTFGGALKALGVYGNKHIPGQYLRASESQRRALLAGLLDTDGYCNDRGGVEFGVTLPRLAEGARELVSSLGYSSTIRMKPVYWKGAQSSTCYVVRFTPPDKVFNLPRKAERQQAGEGIKALRRMITDVRPVPPVPVKCIQVDSADKLYLAGPTAIPTHNTVLLDGLAEWVAACDDALMVRLNLSVKGYAEAESWGPSCWLTAFGPEQKSRAAAVLKVIGAVIEWRARTYKRGQYVPSPDDPAIVVMTDESDSAAGDGTVRAALSMLATKGREYGVINVRAGQRNTRDYADPKARSQDDVWLTGLVRNSNEARHAGSGNGPDMSTYGEGKPGVWKVELLGGAMSLGRAWVFHKTAAGHGAAVERIAAERAYDQPELSGDCREYLGSAYEALRATEVFERWARAQDPGAGPDGDDGDGACAPEAPAAAPAAGPDPVAAPAAPARRAAVAERDPLEEMYEMEMDPGTRARIEKIHEKLGDARRILEDAAAAPRPAPGDPEALAERTASRWRQVDEQTEVPPDVRPRLLAMLEGGTTAAAAAAELGVKRWKALTWLRVLRNEGLARTEGEKRGTRWVTAPPPEAGDAQ